MDIVPTAPSPGTVFVTDVAAMAPTGIDVVPTAPAPDTLLVTDVVITGDGVRPCTDLEEVGFEVGFEVGVLEEVGTIAPN